MKHISCMSGFVQKNKQFEELPTNKQQAAIRLFVAQNTEVTIVNH